MACPQDALQDLLPCNNKLEEEPVVESRALPAVAPEAEPEVEEKMPPQEEKDVEQGATPAADVADAKANTGNDRLAALEAKMMEQMKEMELLKTRVGDLEFDEDVHYPQDCYSFIAVYGPGSAKWHPWIFAFGFLAYLFQMMFLVLLFIYFFRREFFANLKDEMLDPVIVTTQFTAVAFFALMPDASLQDIITAHQIFPRTKTEDKTGRAISCFVRGTQGFMATLVAIILIVASDSAFDIILNFTAVNFISDIDGTLFTLAKNRVFGRTLSDAAKEISNKLLPEQLLAKKHHRYQVVMIATFLFMAIITIIFTVKHEWKVEVYYFLSGNERPV